MFENLPVNPQPYCDTLEVIEADEGETALALSRTMISIARKTFENSGHAIRSVHAKSHGILHGALEVLPDLPPALAQGLFAQPGVYDAVMRLSSTPGDLLHDSVSTPRGIAIKVLEVPGDRLEGDVESRSQDFVAVNGKQFNAASAKEFLKSLKLLAATTDRAEGFKKLASKTLRGIETVVEALGGESAKLKALGGQPETHILGESFFGQLPIRYGSYIAKFGIVPGCAELRRLTDQHLDVDRSPNALREAVSDYFHRHNAVWDFQIQLCSNAAEMPIEDASAVWDEAKSPFITVARLTAPRQESWDGDRSEVENDALGFRPWNALAAHRPLGSIMRIRRLAYRQSQDFRTERNRHPVREPHLRDAAE
ncbi:MAG: catalase [Rhizobiaceae bacterium]|nr:MAG: catalase [Rhizobiaceae bacterium]